jgi:hypothetical protein
VDVFPQFDDIAKLLTGARSERMKRHLISVNVNLLQFFQDVAGIFTSARGSQSDRCARF